VVFLLICGLTALPQGAGAQEWLSDHVPGRILVKFRSGVPDARKHVFVMANGLREHRRIPGIGVHVMDLPKSVSEKDFLGTLQDRPEIEFAEPDRYCSLTMTPDDVYYPSQWHLAKIEAPAAWDIATGAPNVIIACVDTGIDDAHPDLTGQLVSGWNVVAGNSDTPDLIGHGTWVAGTAAAAGNNGIGVASVCWGARIMPIKATSCESCVSASYSLIASGIIWAADHGARVVNASFDLVSGSPTLASAINHLRAKKGVFFSGAGNGGVSRNIADDPNMIVAGATTSSDAIASFSNYGPFVDLSAPGVGIMTTGVGGGYPSVSGTSFSAPVVAGVAALVISVNPNLTSEEIEDVLEQSADDLGAPGWDPYFGWGRVNAARAVRMAAGVDPPPLDKTAPVVGITSPENGTIVSGDLIVKADASDNVGVSSVSLSVDGSQLGSDTDAPYEFFWNADGATPGPHSLRCTAYDAAGNVGESSAVTVYGRIGMTCAVSRKCHGGAGTFDIDLAEGSAIECRTEGPTEVVVTFDSEIRRVGGTLSDVRVSRGTVASISIGGATLAICLSGAVEPGTLDIAFPGIAAADSGEVVSETLSVGVLPGDVSGDGAVNTSDYIVLRGAVGQLVDAGSCRCDVNTDGLIDTSDYICVRGRMDTCIGP